MSLNSGTLCLQHLKGWHVRSRGQQLVRPRQRIHSRRPQVTQHIIAAFEPTSLSCVVATNGLNALLHAPIATTVVSQALSITDDQLFSAFISYPTPVWLLMAVFPRWKYTLPATTAMALVFSALYVVLLGSNLISPPPGAPPIDVSLDGIAAGLGFRENTIPAWAHYIAFDLWTARFMVDDAVKRGVPQLAMVPVLVLTKLFGPAGLLAYMSLVRPLAGKSAEQQSTA